MVEIWLALTLRRKYLVRISPKWARSALLCVGECTLQLWARESTLKSCGTQTTLMVGIFGGPLSQHLHNTRARGNVRRLVQHKLTEISLAKPSHTRALNLMTMHGNCTGIMRDRFPRAMRSRIIDRFVISESVHKSSLYQNKGDPSGPCSGKTGVGHTCGWEPSVLELWADPPLAIEP
jgi:hypothetical protein